MIIVPFGYFVRASLYLKIIAGDGADFFEFFIIGITGHFNCCRALDEQWCLYLHDLGLFNHGLDDVVFRL